MTLLRINKNQIQLSPEHPSLFLSLVPGSIPFHAPVLIEQNGILIDGYRRLLANNQFEIDALRMDVTNIFEAALELNNRTRTWDEADCLLWWKWANSLGVSAAKLPIHAFPDEMKDCSPKILQLLADRKLVYKQVLAIQKAPPAYRDFFVNLLAEQINLNANETADFIEMVAAVKKRGERQSISSLFDNSPLKEILSWDANPKQKGEALLKALRLLRYPYYQKKLEQFTSYWQQLNLGRGIQARKNTFIERGVLEILISSASHQEMREEVSKLSSSLNSPMWEKIWEE